MSIKMKDLLKEDNAYKVKLKKSLEDSLTYLGFYGQDDNALNLQYQIEKFLKSKGM